MKFALKRPYSRQKCPSDLIFYFFLKFRFCAFKQKKNQLQRPRNEEMAFAQNLGKIGENRRKSTISRSGGGPGRKMVDFSYFDDFAQTLNKYHFVAFLSYFKPLNPYVGNFKKIYVKKNIIQKMQFAYCTAVCTFVTLKVHISA